MPQQKNRFWYLVIDFDAVPMVSMEQACRKNMRRCLTRRLVLCCRHRSSKCLSRILPFASVYSSNMSEDYLTAGTHIYSAGLFSINIFPYLGKQGLYRYWSDITNIFEWALYILAFFFALPLENPPSREQWIVGSVALFLTWANLIIFMDR